jgi:hypothetical protein
MNDDGYLGSTAVAELLAKRWTEHRPFFTLNEKPGRGALPAWWLRRPGRARLEQHCSRLTPPPSLVRHWAAHGDINADGQKLIARRALSHVHSHGA